MKARWTVGVGLLLSAASALAGTPQFDALRDGLEAGHVGTVEALVAALPGSLRDAYALAFASRSLQGASFASPRAILYGTDATFIVTFNGEAPERGHATVETMEFDASANRFVLREIGFAADGDPAGRSISEPNPARCLACHGTPARPIWDLPPAWPGIYGERYGAGLSSAEKAGIEAFLARQPTHPRYRYLEDATRFAARSNYVPDGRAVYSGASLEPPNARLSTLLAALNARSILAELVAAPGFAAHRYALLAATSAACGPPEAYYPQSRQGDIRREFGAFRERTRLARAREANAKTERRTGVKRAASGAGATAGLEALRFVTEEGLGLSTAHWSLALEHGAAARAAPEGATTLERGLLELAAAEDPGLRNLVTYRGYTATDGYCSYLKRESRRALAAWDEGHPPRAALASAAPLATATAGAPAPALLGSCAACHTGEVAPAIPFSVPDLLAERLLEGEYPHGRLLDEILYRLGPESGAARMPRGTTVTAAEQHELEVYFLSLPPRLADRR